MMIIMMTATTTTMIYVLCSGESDGGSRSSLACVHWLDGGSDEGGTPVSRPRCESNPEPMRKGKPILKKYAQNNEETRGLMDRFQNLANHRPDESPSETAQQEWRQFLGTSRADPPGFTACPESNVRRDSSTSGALKNDFRSHDSKFGIACSSEGAAEVPLPLSVGHVPPSRLAASHKAPLPAASYFENTPPSKSSLSQTKPSNLKLNELAMRLPPSPAAAIYAETMFSCWQPLGPADSAADRRSADRPPTEANSSLDENAHGADGFGNHVDAQCPPSGGRKKSFRSLNGDQE